MNWNITTGQRVDALIAVAHPDDEIIFCGGIMLCYPSWHWTVVTFTGPDDSERVNQSKRAMAYLKDLGIRIESYQTLGQADTGDVLSDHEFLAWESAIQEKSYVPTLVFTHNTEGEYGHPHHKSANRIINELYPNVWEFICPGAGNVSPQPTKAKINEVPLSNDILAKKKYIFDHFYVTEHYLWKNLRDVMEYEFNKGPEIFTSG